MRRLRGAAAVAIALFLANSGAAGSGVGSVFNHFVGVRGDRLMDGDQPLRFVSFNIPNLLLIEDDMAFTRSNPWRLPVEYEVRDALVAVRQAGGTVARTYTISVARPDDDPGTPKHVLGPGQFNEEAFRALDTVLAVANRVGVRLIIPLVDNWKWMGGVPQYAAFRGKSPDEFWTDRQLREDFKRTIAFVLNRVNTVTSVPYREDKAILAWELGNELRNCPREWAEEMAAYIKSLDPNHLVADGVQAHEVRDWALQSPVIDLVSTHHYEGDPLQMVANIRRAAQRARGKKPYYIGEFGFLTEPGIRHVLNVVLNTPNIAGALIWSLRFHNRDGGFYWHSEPAGGRLYRAYHWPGFPSGEAYSEIGVLSALRTAAYAIRGIPLPPAEQPDPPQLLPVADPGHIRWRGSAGAFAYVVERSESRDRPWRVIGQRVDDAAVAYAPLFSDESAEIGRTYFYRVRAIGPGGVSKPSNVEGPVLVEYLTYVDEFANLQRCYQSGGDLSLEQLGARAYKEDIHRVKMSPGAWIRYWVAGDVRRVQLRGFSEGDSLAILVCVSTEGAAYEPVSARQQAFPMNKRDYPYLTPVLVDAEIRGGGVRFVEIRAEQAVQLGRIEIEYE